MSRLTEFERLARSIKHCVELQESIGNSLAYAGPMLLAALTLDQSLRKIAELSGLSPTYLSMVASRKQVISPQSYLVLNDLYNGRKR